MENERDIMTHIKRVSRGELTAREVVDIVNAGGRVLIELGALGLSTTLVIRHHNGTYYCDTPMKLLTHATEDELCQCLRKFKLVRPDARENAESTGASV